MRRSKGILLIMAITFALILSGCSAAGSKAEGKYIIDVDSVAKLVLQEGTIFIDMQKAENYAQGHVKGAVNITRNDIVINQPVSNMLAPKETIEQVLGTKGIGNNNLVIAYDDTDNMDAARLWWTLTIYGFDNVKVLSGGIKALQKAGIELTAENPVITPVTITLKDLNVNMIAGKNEVLAQVNEPSKDVFLLDTRTQEEYNQGSIPGSVLFDYINNNNSDATYKSRHAIIMQYNDLGLKPEMNVIMYCKTSVRAAQTYLALANAGYEHLKLYDGAWLEWSADQSLPAQEPTESKIQPGKQDNS